MDNEIKKLSAGYARFRNLKAKKSDHAYKEILQKPQRPIALLITCCDARIEPVRIFDCSPGDLYLIRNVANLIPPYEMDSHYHGTSAALEFGICYLNIPHIIILGHSECGGIQSLFEKHSKQPNSFIDKWMGMAQIACKLPDTIADMHSAAERTNQENLCAKQALLGSMNNLMTFPWIKEKVDAGSVQLHAWYFNLSEGIIDVFKADSQDFEPLEG
jgi:carbonic anhydrase